MAIPLLRQPLDACSEAACPRRGPLFYRLDYDTDKPLRYMHPFFILSADLDRDADKPLRYIHTFFILSAEPAYQRELRRFALCTW